MNENRISQHGRAMSSVLEAPSPPVNPVLDLSAYDGEWNFESARHLLRRATMGATLEEIQMAEGLGLDGTLEKLFEELPPPDLPINYYFENDPNVPIGSTWVEQPAHEPNKVTGPRKNSLRAWAFQRWIDEGISIREKLTMFWHNHFAVSVNMANDPTFIFHYEMLLQSYAWGNFKALVKEITINPAMLRFLNGNQNTEKAPNENFARELLELYTVGKGQLAGPGDYTTFTEQDVSEVARVLTGWKDTGYRRKDTEVDIGVIYRADKHDTGVKQLSPRLGGHLINNMGDQEYVHLIDLIFQQRAAATYICEKLYRWFIYYEISDEVRATIIEAMADELVANDFEIKPVLMTLLRSQHFFDILNWGPMIKNPIEYMVSLIKQNYVTLPENLNDRYFFALKLYQRLNIMQMDYYSPPEVAGWSAYYRSPGFYRIWINATTLTARMFNSEQVATRGFRFAGMDAPSQPMRLLENVSDPLDPNVVVRDIVKALYPMPLTDGQYDALKEILIPGLPDFEWTVEYGMLLENPEDEEVQKSIENKLRDLLGILLNLAEYQLS